MPNQPLTFENIENKDMQSETVTLFGASPVTAANYGTFFIASRPYEVMEVRAVWSTASSSGTLMLERLQGTTAQGSGDDVLAATIDTSGTANTVVVRQKTDLQNRELLPGNRLALEDGGTLTGLADLTVTVLLKPLGKGGYI